MYARIQSGEYKIEEGWDGIKPSALFGRPNSLDFNLVVAEPEKSTCCWFKFSLTISFNNQIICNFVTITISLRIQWWIFFTAKSCWMISFVYSYFLTTRQIHRVFISWMNHLCKRLIVAVVFFSEENFQYTKKKSFQKSNTIFEKKKYKIVLC